MELNFTKSPSEAVRHLKSLGISIVDENTRVQVGKYYKVVCAILLSPDSGRIDYIPVIGAIHNDKQFGVEYDHIHVDGRFMSDSVDYRVKSGRSNMIIDVNKDMAHATSSVFYGLCVKRRKCRYENGGINPPAKGLTFTFGSKLYWNWYDSYIGKSCKGKKCPHLGTKMQEKEGKLFCPLHNLEGCIKSEKIILPQNQ